MAVYSALYRQWRPRRLAELVGQEHVARTLRNALAAGHAAHAYLFCGPRGTGKTSTARIVAAALNCAHAVDGDACGECAACRDVASDRLIDVQEIDAASNRQVDDMRALRETVGYAPVSGRHKVYILDEVHMLTDASWNTLLKTLEEPPPATTFVLCTTDPRKVLPTVVSRCQRFDFRRLTAAEIEAHLNRICAAEGIRCTSPALEVIARRADGGLRDALSLLDQASAFVSDGEVTAEAVAAMLGAADDAAVGRMIDAARGGDAATVLTEIDRLYGDGKDMGQVMRDVLSGIRDRLVRALRGRAAGHLSAGADGAGPEEVRWYTSAIETLADIDGQMRRAEQPRLLLEVGMIRILAGLNGADTTEPPTAAPRSNAGDAGRRQPSGPQRPGTRGGGDAGSPATHRPAPPTADAAPDQDRRPAQSAPPGGQPEDAVADGGEAATPAADPAWDVFLEMLRRTSVPAHSTLQGGHFRGRRDGNVVVAFHYPGQVPIAEGKRAVIERVWERLSGAPARFHFVADSNAGEPSTSVRDWAKPGAVAPHSTPRGTAVREPESPRSGEAHMVPPTDGSAPAEPLEGDAVGGRPHPDASTSDVEVLFQRALTLFQGTVMTAG